MSLLEDIVANKRREVEELRRQPRKPSTRRPIDVVDHLRRAPGAPLRLIAEVKRKSPSAGPLSTALDPAARALAYAEAGASMVSVLCDGPFFAGAWSHLEQARERLDAAGGAVPLLAKEFVIDARQVAEARDRGADAVLLIVRILDGRGLAALARAARAEGLEPLVEVTDERELGLALDAGARVVGVNARDLDKLGIDKARAARVSAAIPAEVVAVHLSGLREPADVASVARTRVDAALIGEALMRDDDPRPRLGALVRAAAGETQ